MLNVILTNAVQISWTSFLA